MAFSTPKLKIEYLDGSDLEVQTIPMDAVLTGRKYPDVDLGGDSSIFAQLDAIMYLAWIALIRQRQITDATQRQKFETWGNTVATVDFADDDEATEDPTSPPDQTESS